MTDYSGGTYTFYATDTNYNSTNFEVHNNSGVTKEWVITRVRINPPATWSDYLCWGHQDDPFGGTCVTAESMDSVYYQMASTDKVELNDGEYGKLLVYQKPTFSPTGSFIYRYYVGPALGAYEDSIDVEVIVSGVGLTEHTPAFDMQIAPNPSSEYVHVRAEKVHSGTLSIVELKGKAIQTQDFSSNATINTSALETGVYFIILSTKEGMRRSEKLIVK